MRLLVLLTLRMEHFLLKALRCNRIACIRPSRLQPPFVYSAQIRYRCLLGTCKGVVSEKHVPPSRSKKEIFIGRLIEWKLFHLPGYMELFPNCHRIATLWTIFPNSRRPTHPFSYRIYPISRNTLYRWRISRLLSSVYELPVDNHRIIKSCLFGKSTLATFSTCHRNKSTKFQAHYLKRFRIFQKKLYVQFWVYVFRSYRNLVIDPFKS